MIALVVSLLVAVYVLGPDLVSRWILGFVAPRKSLVQTRSEEVARGFLWSIIPFVVALMLRHVGPLSLAPNSKVDLQTFFSGLYSESFFDQHRQEFFASANSFIYLNACLGARLYTIVVVGSVALNFLIGKYGVMREWIASHPRFSWLRAPLSTIILPRVSEWHVILSPMLLPSQDMNIEVDVLTKSGTLYQGAFKDKNLASDGSLQSVTLGNPLRFQRDRYLDDRKTNLQTDPKKYWKLIPGQVFVIMGPDITTLNIRHMPATVGPFRMEFDDIAKAIRLVKEKVSEIQRTTQSESRPKHTPPAGHTK